MKKKVFTAVTTIALLCALIEITAPVRAYAIVPYEVAQAENSVSLNLYELGLTVQGTLDDCLDKQFPSTSPIGPAKCNIIVWMIAIIVVGLIIYLIYRACDNIPPPRRPSNLFLADGRRYLVIEPEASTNGTNSSFSFQIESSTNLLSWVSEFTIRATNGASGVIEMVKDGTVVQTFQNAQPVQYLDAELDSTSFFYTNSPLIIDDGSPAKFFRYVQ